MFFVSLFFSRHVRKFSFNSITDTYFVVYLNIDLNLARVEIRKSFVQRDKQMCYGWIKEKKKICRVSFFVCLRALPTC